MMLWREIRGAVRPGVTLTELGIVLGILAVLLGIVVAALPVVYDSISRSQYREETASLRDGVQKWMAFNPTSTAITFTDLAEREWIPPKLRNGADPWGGSYQIVVQVDTNGAPTTVLISSSIPPSGECYDPSALSPDNMSCRQQVWPEQ